MVPIQWRAHLALSLAALGGSAWAQPAPDTQALRRELEALRADYETRLRALEQRLRAAEAALAAPAPAPATVVAPAAAAPAPLATAASARGLTPAISLILSGQYAGSRRDPEGYRIRGFSLPPDAEVGPSRGFSLGETELAFSASVDPWFRGAATFAVGAENDLSVEDAFIETTALGRGLTVRAGRFLSGVGYLNPQHRHAWDFVDPPLAYQALLGTQYGEDGLQFTWLAPTDRFLELKAEVGRGRSFPGSDTARNGAGMFSLSAHAGDDIGTSHSWRAGLSLLSARASGQELAGLDAAGNDIQNSFSGRTRVWIADAVWRWAPGGNPARTHFKLQGEYLRSSRQGELVVDTAGAASPGSYRAVQSGWYLQGVYQFMPRWRAGLRTESLRPGAPDFGPNAGLAGTEEGTPRKHTLLLEHRPSEFSRIRLQLARDRARAGAADWQWLLQYQMSLGAHGAHGF